MKDKRLKYRRVKARHISGPHHQHIFKGRLHSHPWYRKTTGFFEAYCHPAKRIYFLDFPMMDMDYEAEKELRIMKRAMEVHNDWSAGGERVRTR